MSRDLVHEVITVVAKTLAIEERAPSMSAATPLFGSMPELDSLAVLELVSALEDEFGIVVDDEEFGGDIFETVGSLAEFVGSKKAA